MRKVIVERAGDLTSALNLVEKIALEFENTHKLIGILVFPNAQGYQISLTLEEIT